MQRYSSLRRRKAEPMRVKEKTVIRCPSHLAWVRGFECAAINRRSAHECFGKIEAAHVRTGTDGGTSMKPSDCWTIPLCAAAHREQHDVGEPAFERMYGISMRQVAERLWRMSPHRVSYEQKQQEGR